MSMGINKDDTPMSWDVYVELIGEIKKFERERQVVLLNAKEKAHAAIKEFLKKID